MRENLNIDRTDDGRRFVRQAGQFGCRCFVTSRGDIISVSKLENRRTRKYNTQERIPRSMVVRKGFNQPAYRNLTASKGPPTQSVSEIRSKDEEMGLAVEMNEQRSKWANDRRGHLSSYPDIHQSEKSSANRPVGMLTKMTNDRPRIKSQLKITNFSSKLRQLRIDEVIRVENSCTSVIMIDKRLCETNKFRRFTREKQVIGFDLTPTQSNQFNFTKLGTLSISRDKPHAELEWSGKLSDNQTIHIWTVASKGLFGEISKPAWIQVDIRGSNSSQDAIRLIFDQEHRLRYCVFGTDTVETSVSLDDADLLTRHSDVLDVGRDGWLLSQNGITLKLSSAAEIVNTCFVAVNLFAELGKRFVTIRGDIFSALLVEVTSSAVVRGDGLVFGTTTDDVTSIGDETFAIKLPSSANKPTTT
ncbi:phospholipase A2 isozyme PA4 precursor [Clonorchis sinensis]|uniref:Phospholipase A2 isozyme PA4 n=1 Tax=Clonorchis sinensis TaxID=79923 RepID=G7Y472_CLOSI|nr:phospholipase A2 isozyme PA4 precursor [Clonorchis sinensis]